MHRGPAKGQQPGKIGHIGRVRFTLSPEEVQKPDGTDDRATRNYALAYAAYTQAFGEVPTTVQDLVDYLTKYPLAVDLIQVGIKTKNNPEPSGEPGTFVIGIYAQK